MANSGPENPVRTLPEADRPAACVFGAGWPGRTERRAGEPPGESSTCGKTRPRTVSPWGRRRWAGGHGRESSTAGSRKTRPNKTGSTAERLYGSKAEQARSHGTADRALVARRVDSAIVDNSRPKHCYHTIQEHTKRGSPQSSIT